MLDAIKRSKVIIKTNNSSYGSFIYNDKKYFFKIVDREDFFKEVE